MKNVLKKFQELEKGIRAALVIFFILVLADIVSTLMSWKLLEYLEANPLYKYGGIPLIFFVNIIFMFIFYKIYTKTNNVNLRFYILFVLAAIITTRVMVIFSNVQVAMNPPTVEYLMSIPEESLQQMKVEAHTQLIVLNMLPMVNGALTWILFKKDHEVKRWKRLKKKISQKKK